MRTFLQLLRESVHASRAATTVEYAIMLGLVAAIIIAAVLTLGVSGLYCSVQIP